MPIPYELVFQHMDFREYKHSDHSKDFVGCLMYVLWKSGKGNTMPKTFKEVQPRCADIKQDAIKGPDGAEGTWLNGGVFRNSVG